MFYMHFIYFYASSRTNLLTRCHSASSLFSAVFGFKKVRNEIFSELDDFYSDSVFHGECSRKSNTRDRGAATTCSRGSNLCRASNRCGALRPPPTSPFRLHIPPETKTLARCSYFPPRVPSRRRRQHQFGRDQNSPPAPCREGESSSEGSTSPSPPPN